MRQHNQTWMVLSGLGLGAGLMYALDPRHGARRRAVMRDKTMRAFRRERHMLGQGARDLGHRASGSLRKLRRDEQPVSDEVLIERVRAAMGRHISHPSAVEVAANDGRITLRGALLSGELDDLVECVHRVRGVEDVVTELELHESSDDVPELQGPGRIRSRTAVAREIWPPSVRLLATGTGTLLAAAGLKRGNLSGAALTAAGTYLLVRATTNLPAKRMFGVGAGRRAVDLQKTITVHAPIDRVYRFLTDIENFPRFMRHVQAVRRSDRDPRSSHWRVQGLGGISLSWDAVETERDDQRIFAWRTRPGQVIEHAGVIRLTEQGSDSTRVHIQMSYNPPAGAVGHAVLRLVGSDPKSMLDDDLVRLKSLLEQGKTRAHGERVNVNQLQ